MAFLDLKIPSTYSQSAIICNKEIRLLLLREGQARLPILRRSSQHLKLKCFSELPIEGPVHSEDNISQNGQVKPSTISAPNVQRRDFPPNFLFGASTSALQTEGSGKEGGRGPSTWDSLIGEGRIAVDSYNRYDEDVQLLKQMSVNAYRFSIAWPRILPKGTISGGINKKGIQFYKNLIKELKDNGITPFATLFHCDLPQALQDKYGGFLNPRIVDDFENYADLCFQEFGGDVKHWTTFNEPQIFGEHQVVGNTKKNATDTFRANHHIILAHAAAAKLYKEKYQGTQRGEIGISLMCKWFEPHDPTSRHDRDAAERATDFLLGWYMDPLVSGDYPFFMKALVRDGLPKFSDKKKDLVKGSCDFIGVNYYTSRYAKSLPFDISVSHEKHDGYQYADLKEEKDGKSIGTLADGSDSNKIYIYPEGLRKILIHLKNEYNNPKIYITENGVPSKRDDSKPEAALKDNFRIEHIRQHLDAVKEARKEGANVNGFFIWSLMDNMEMDSGYNIRFGLNYTDYADGLKRYPKESAKWLGSFMRGELSG